MVDSKFFSISKQKTNLKKEKRTDSMARFNIKYVAANINHFKYKHIIMFNR